MADIRINALATTAASTASDDFIAVDGSANGTRKLNAYSPTFGGNLTVSGTALLGTSDANSGAYFDYNTGIGGASALWMKQTTKSAATATLVGGGTYTVLNAASGGSVLIRIANADGITLDSSRNTTLAGNLTVSGTGTHSFAGQVTSTVNAANTSNLGSFVASNATLNSFTSYSPSASLDQKYWTWQSGTAVGDGIIRLRALNDAQTNGINAITVTRSGISSTAVNVGGNLTVSGGTVTSGTGTLTLNSSANTVVLQSAGTTALTLDSSQNATFAGKIFGSSGTAAAPSLSFSGDTDSGFYNAGGNQVALACGGVQIWNTTVNGLSFAVGKDIYLGNAYVTGAPTATGYVTIKDSAGITYKVLVST